MNKIVGYLFSRENVYLLWFFSSWFKIITPSKRKMSEASMIVPGADRYTVRSPILLVDTCKFYNLKRFLTSII